MDKDQLDAITKIDEVTIQLELTRDLQKQFVSLSADVRACTCLVNELRLHRIVLAPEVM